MMKLDQSKLMTNDHTLILFIFPQKLSLGFEPKKPSFHIQTSSSLDNASWQFMNVSSDAQFQLIQYIWGRLRDIVF